MKKLLIAALTLLIAGFTYGQQQATEGRSEFQKTQQPAAVITLPYQDDVVEKAIADYMSRKGIKGNSSNGYKLYRNYKLGTSDQPSDLYFKVDRKSRSEKDISVVSLVVGRSMEDIKSRQLSDSVNTLDGAKELLNDMVASIDVYNLNVQIENQEDIVKKAQKKYDGLQDDEKDDNKKIRDLEQKLAQNKLDQNIQADAIKNNIHGDEKSMQKAQKRMRNLVDEQFSAEKKIRNLQSDLEQNKRDQQKQLDEVNKQKEILSTLMARRKTN